MARGCFGSGDKGRIPSREVRKVRRNVWLIGSATVLAGLCASRQACAASGALADASGAYTHDGFYMRIATGFGAYNERAFAPSSEAYGGALQARARGFAVASEFAMGGTPWAGFVIGGGIYSTEVYSASLNFSREGVEPEDLADEARNYTLLAVFADRYFVPNVGLHVQAALGVSFQSALTVDVDVDSENDDYEVVGPGFMLGLGYEMWIAEQWSLGVLARFGSSVLFGRDSNEVNWVHVITTLPTFLMTVTYH